MFENTQSLINYWRHTKAVGFMVSKYEPEICKDGEVCKCKETGVCAVQMSIEEDLIVQNRKFLKGLGVGEPDCNGEWSLFTRSVDEMEVNHLNEPCKGRTAIRILKESLDTFQSHRDVAKLLKSDRCPDGTIKTAEVCKRGWRGETCFLCPLLGV
ncbi:MAG: hypothetical protein HQL70_11640 [Magnetococcales bacterium]|nr:hypothetical protein [Magnetococcales bacterium]